MLSSFVADARGEVQVVTLPSAMSDIAINPKTGDLATVDPKTNRAYLFREAAISGEKAVAAGNVQLGNAPMSIAYKRYGEMEIYVAVCAEDSHMYVIDAKNFAIVKKIPLASKDILQVLSSSNPKDPFVYYTQRSSICVVDLRNMTDLGIVLSDPTNCMISPDGRFVYSGDSGAVKMTNSFRDNKPTFVRKPNPDRARRGVFLPGPFGKFTASNQFVFTQGLEKSVAKLEFTPLCFFSNPAYSRGN